MSETSRWLDWINIDDIRPAVVNPKLHAKDSLRASVDAHGYIDPLIIDERTGRLVAGHGRLEELQRRRKVGEDAPDGITVHDNQWSVPVIRGWASRDDAHATSYLLGSNRITEAGGWQQDEVAALLTALEEGNPALVLAAGYDAEAIDAVLKDAGDDMYPDADGSDDDWETITLRVPPDVATLLRARLDTYVGPESEKVRQLALDV